MTHGWLTPRPFAVAERLLRGAVANRLGSAAQAAVSIGEHKWQAHAGRTERERQVLGVGPSARVQPSPGRPIDATTAFDLASLTKPIATVTRWAQVLSRRGADLRLDAALDDVLPDARGTPLGASTLHHLLGHASGAPAWLDFWSAIASLTPPERADRVRKAVLATPLDRPAGAKAVYSDVGYLALGFALEALDGRPLDDQFAAEIAAPLGLHLHFRRRTAALQEPPGGIAATEIDPSRRPDGRALRGEVHDSNAAALGGVAGHAGLFGSAGDVLTWAQAWLHLLRAPPGRLAGPLGIDPAVARHFVATSAASSTSWRLGWDTPSQPGSTAGATAPTDAIGHLGFTGTSIWMAPSADTCAVLVTNRVHPSRLDVARIRDMRPRFHDAVWASASALVR